MATWKIVTTPNIGVNGISDIVCVGSGLFVAVGSGGVVLTSSDAGQSWQSQTAAEANDWNAVAYDGVSTIVAVAGNGTHRVMTSTDAGHTWTARTAAEADTWFSVCWAPVISKFVAVNNAGVHRVMTSADGITWAAVSGNNTGTWSGVAANGSLIMCLDGFGRVATSPDGTTWTLKTSSGVSQLQSQGSNPVVYDSTSAKFWTAGYHVVSLVRHAVVASSTDGVAWNLVSASPLDAYGTFMGFATAPSYGGFLGALPYDTTLTNNQDVIGSSIDDGLTWTAIHYGLALGVWYPAAWDNTTKTWVGWDSNGTNSMLVGSFQPVLKVTSVNPNAGSFEGGTNVTITGQGFSFATGSVTFGGLAATSVVIVNDTTITCVTPTHATGAVDVVVAGVGTLVGGYTYTFGTIALPPQPYKTPIVQAQSGTISTPWSTWLRQVVQAINDTPESKIPAENIVGVLNVAQIPTLPWSRIDKTGSSLADLALRSAAAINAGVLATIHGGSGSSIPVACGAFDPGSFTVPPNEFLMFSDYVQLGNGEVLTVNAGSVVRVL